MAGRLGARSFHRDPLGFVEREFDRHGDFFRLPDGSLCVADPATALAVLRDEHGVYGAESDFFATPAGRVRPRSAQVAIGRDVRHLLQRHAQPRLQSLTAAAADLPVVTEWPATGSRLLLDHLRGALVNDERPGDLSSVVAEVAERGYLVRPRGAIRLARHRKVRSTIVEKITLVARARQARPEPEQAADLLDSIVHSGPDGVPPDAAATVYLMLLRSAVAPIAHTVSWALDLLAQSVQTSQHTPEAIIRESLRLRPVAWLVGRTAHAAHPVGPCRLAPGDKVVVCSHLIHRHPDHWADPRSFLPQRWDAEPPRAYLPFGAGPFVCAGAGIAMSIASALLHGVIDGRRVHAAPGSRPHVEGIVAHPPFLVERRAVSRTKGGAPCSSDSSARKARPGRSGDA